MPIIYIIELSLFVLLTLISLFVPLIYPQFYNRYENLFYFLAYIISIIFIILSYIRKDIVYRKKCFKKYYIPKLYKENFKYAYPNRKRDIIVFLIYLAYILVLCLTRNLLESYFYLLGLYVLLTLNWIFIHTKYCLIRLLVLKDSVSCCKNCTLTGWDHVFLFSLFIFVPYTNDINKYLKASILIISFLIALIWEWLLFKFPERFTIIQNAYLKCNKCINCQQIKKRGRYE